MKIVLAISWFIPSARADEPPAFTLVVPEPDSFVSELCFPSGLRVTIQNDSRQHLASVTTVVDGGFGDADARAGQTPHLLEHAWFLARPGGGATVRERLLSLGAEYNGWTMLDTTAFTTIGPVQALPELLALEAARLVDPIAGLDDAALATERTVVHRELAEGLGGGAVDANAVLRTVLFPAGHPYSTASSASEGDLASIGLSELNTWRGTWYRPENVTVAIAGDVNARTLQPMLEKAFGEDLLYKDRSGAFPKKGDCSPRAVAASSAPVAPVRADAGTQQLPIERPVVLLGWSMPPGYSANDLGARIAVMYLRSSLEQVDQRLGTRGLLDVSCAYQPGLRASLATCALTLAPRASLERVLREVRAGRPVEVLSTDLAHGQFDQARSALFGETLRRFDVPAGPWDTSSIDPVLYSHIIGSPTWSTDSLTQLEKFDLTSADALSKTWLSPERMVYAVFLPPGADVSGADEGASERESAWSASAPPPADGLVRQLPLVAASSQTPVGEPFALATLRQETLPNGMKVVVYPYGDAPLAHVALRFGGGWVTEPEVGTDALAWSVTGFHPEPLPFSFGIAKLAIGAEWDVTTSAVSRTAHLTTSSGNVDDALYLLGRFAMSAEAVEDWRPDALHGWQDVAEAMAADPASRAQAARDAHLYAGHPLGLGVEAWVDRAQLVDANELDRWVQNVYRPDNATLIVVGRVNPDEVLSYARTRFASWKQPKKPIPAAPPLSPATAAAARSVQVFDATGALATVEVACQVKPFNDEVGHVLRGTVEQLAWTSLREGSGLTYTPAVRLIHAPGAPDVLSVRATVAPAQAGQAARAVLESFASLQRAAPADLVAAVKVHRAATLPLAWHTGDDVVDRLVEGYDAGGLVAVFGRRDRLEKVAPADLQTTLAQCVGHEIVTVVGPEAVVKPLVAPLL